MKSFNIRLKEINDVYKLVNTLLAYDGAVDLGSGRYIVDGRSLLGIFSLDLSKPVTMEIYSDDCDQLLEELKPFLA